MVTSHQGGISLVKIANHRAGAGPFVCLVISSVMIGLVITWADSCFSFSALPPLAAVVIATGSFVAIFYWTRPDLLLSSTFLFWLEFMFFHYLPIVGRYLGSSESFSLFLIPNLAVGSLAIGVVVASVHVGFRPASEFSRYRILPVIDPTDDTYSKSAFILLLLVAVAGSVLYLVTGYQNARGIPILEALSGGNVLEIRESRFAFSDIVSAGYFYQFYGNLLPFLAAYALGKGICRQSRWWWALFVTTALWTTLVNLAGGARAPTLDFLMLLVIVVIWFRGRSHLWIGLGMVLILGLFVALTSLLYGVPFDNALDISASRIFYTQSVGLEFVLSMFPRFYPYEYGQSILRDLIGVLPGRQEGSATVIAAMRVARSRNNPIGAVGDLYVDFGPVGVALGMVIIGYLLQRLTIHYVRGERTVVNTVTGAALNVALGRLAITSMVGTIFQFGVMMFAFAGVYLDRSPGVLARLSGRHSLIVRPFYKAAKIVREERAYRK